MGQARRGRPPKPLDRSASEAARLGAEIRARRLAQNLTLEALSELAGFSYQHVSEVERAKSTASQPFVAAVDRALGADGALLALLPAVMREWTATSDERRTARRLEMGAASYDDHVDPTNRRGLLGAGAAALGGGLGAAALGAPTAGREVDPELVAHWTRLLDLLGRHNAMFGPHDVLPTVRHELELIARHRLIASGDLRINLMCVESRWTAFAAWVSNDTGRLRSRDALTGRALRLAREAGWRDGVAFARLRQSQWAAQELDAHRAITFAEAALRVPGTSKQTRARCELRAAFGHALAHDAGACERSLAAAEGPLEHADEPSQPPPWVGRTTIRSHLRPDEARCWLHMQPSKAIPLYEDVVREWPRDQRTMGVMHQARLALACAATGERDRAEIEGRKALAIARTTKSGRAARELKRLGVVLAA
jgi:transcriptional regulator with XRE-family HTH domain